MPLEHVPTINDVREALEAIRPYINSTPIHEWKGRLLSKSVAEDTEVVLKLELFQRAGSFKARGALLGILALNESARRCGVDGARICEMCCAALSLVGGGPSDGSSSGAPSRGTR